MLGLFVQSWFQLSVSASGICRSARSAFWKKRHRLLLVLYHFNPTFLEPKTLSSEDVPWNTHAGTYTHIWRPPRWQVLSGESTVLHFVSPAPGSQEVPCGTLQHPRQVKIQKILLSGRPACACVSSFPLLLLPYFHCELLPFFCGSKCAGCVGCEHCLLPPLRTTLSLWFGWGEVSGCNFRDFFKKNKKDGELCNRLVIFHSWKHVKMLRVEPLVGGGCIPRKMSLHPVLRAMWLLHTVVLHFMSLVIDEQ